MDGHIVVTGATGNTGQVIAAELQKLKIPFAAMVRSDTNRAILERQGIQSVMGDFDNPPSLGRALSGAAKVYLVCTPDEKLIPREMALISEAKKAGVRHIVKCSAYTADVHANTQNLRSHGAIERALMDSGMDYTIIRPHGFMQTFTLFSWNLIEKVGVFSSPIGEGALPLVDVRDVAMTAVKALTESGHGGKAYDITGPEALTGHSIAHTLERVLGHRVDYVPSSEREFSWALSLLGVTQTPKEHAIVVMREVREGRLSNVHATLEEIGIQPTSYEQFIRDLRARRTGGGNSFKPPNTMMFRVLDTVMPAMMKMRMRVFGRVKH